MNRTLPIILIIILTCVKTTAQDLERTHPEAWENLVFGGRFMDRFLPMPDLGGETLNTWGASKVVPRDILNGIEDSDWSYWGGNIRLMDDGKYHLFVCRWPENSVKGHMEWPRSHVVHAVSNNQFGPYKVIDEVGKGHNPEWFINKDGKYLIYIRGKYYVSETINGPWEHKKLDFNKRDRKVLELMSNLTFAKREDGSMIMVNRGGGVWVSKDGVSQWNQVSDGSIYPPVEGRFEDPVIWKTNVQYHLIVNDWLGRIAWYMRSKDGIHWKTDTGEAYMPGIAKHTDGTKEDWYKYERIKVLQDEYGRAVQANFAVIDTLKRQDLANDNHSSKNITIPLTVGKLISIENKKPIDTKTRKIVVKIKAEKGFNPNKDIDFESLRFGASEEVNFGRGAKVKSIKAKGQGVIITFEGKGNGITDDNFVAKMLGKDKKGNLLFGYARLPGVNYMESFLSPLKPKILFDQKKIEIEVQNFGQVRSVEGKLSLCIDNNGKEIEIGKATIPELNPFEKATIVISNLNKILGSKDHNYVIVINDAKRSKFSIE